MPALDEREPHAGAVRLDRLRQLLLLHLHGGQSVRDALLHAALRGRTAHLPRSVPARMQLRQPARRLQPARVHREQVGRFLLHSPPFHPLHSLRDSLFTLLVFSCRVHSTSSNYQATSSNWISYTVNTPVRLHSRFIILYIFVFGFRIMPYIARCLTAHFLQRLKAIINPKAPTLALRPLQLRMLIASSFSDLYEVFKMVLGLFYFYLF